MWLFYKKLPNSFEVTHSDGIPTSRIGRNFLFGWWCRLIMLISVFRIPCMTRTTKPVQVFWKKLFKTLYTYTPGNNFLHLGQYHTYPTRTIYRLYRDCRGKINLEQGCMGHAEGKSCVFLAKLHFSNLRKFIFKNCIFFS